MLEQQLYRTTWLGLKSRPFDHYPADSNYFASVGTCVAHDKKHRGNSYLYKLSINLNMDFLDVAIHSNNLQWQDIQINKIMNADIMQPKFFLVQLQHPYYWENSKFYKFLGDENIGHKHPLPTKEAYIKGCNFLKKMVSSYINKPVYFFNHICYSAFEFKMLQKTIGGFSNVLLDRWISKPEQDNFDDQTQTMIADKIYPWLKEKIK